MGGFGLVKVKWWGKVEIQDPGQNLSNDAIQTIRNDCTWCHAVWLSPDQCICRHQDTATDSPALIRVSQEVSYLAPVTQTLSKPCYFARTESENCMTHKTENWRVFSPVSPGRAQAINRNNEAVMRSDSTDITRCQEELPHNNLRCSDRSRLSVQTSHINTQREYIDFTSLLQAGQLSV